MAEVESPPAAIQTMKSISGRDNSVALASSTDSRSSIGNSSGPIGKLRIFNQTGLSINQATYRLALQDKLELGSASLSKLGKIHFDAAAESSGTVSFNRERGFGVSGLSSAIAISAHLQEVKFPVTVFTGVASGGLPTLSGQSPSIGVENKSGGAFFAGVQTDRSLLSKTFKFGKDNRNEVGVIDTQAGDYFVKEAGRTGNIFSIRARLLKLHSLGTLGARFDLRSGALANDNDSTSFRLTYKTPPWFQERCKALGSKGIESMKSTLKNWFNKD